MICSGCGHQFNEKTSAKACMGCVSRGGCGNVRCPHCGMEAAREPAFIHRLRAMFRLGKQHHTQTHGTGCVIDYKHAFPETLDELQRGQSAQIESFSDLAHVRKFLSLGILPGTSITILKQFPAVVLRVGYSEFAIDRPLASTVRVRVP